MRRLHTPVSRSCAKAHPSAYIARNARLQSSVTQPAGTAAAAVAAPTVRVRSEGYGPSRDLLKGVGPRSRLRVETALHPEDAKVQQRVLSLAMPSLAEVSVVPSAAAGTVVSLVSSPPAGASAVLSFQAAAAAAEKVGEMDARMEVLESTLQGQLATVANLVVERVAEQTGLQLSTLEVAQSAHGRTLSELVIATITKELARVERSVKTSGAATPDATAGTSDALNVAEISRRVSEQVAKAVCASMSSMPRPTTDGGVEALERSIESHFSSLESQLKATVNAQGRNSSLSSEMRDGVVSAIEELLKAQQEALESVVEGLLEEHLSRGGKNKAAVPVSAADLEDMRDFVEGSLRTASEDIRHAVSGEVKKLARVMQKRQAGLGKEDGSGADVDLEALAKDLEKVAASSEDILAIATSTDETIGDLFKMQSEMKDVLLNIKEMVGSSAAAERETVTTNAGVPDEGKETRAADREASAARDARLTAAVEELKAMVAAASAAADVRSERGEDQLLTVARTVSDCVSAALESKTQDAMQSTLALVREELAGFTAQSLEATKVLQETIANEKQLSQGQTELQLPSNFTEEVAQAVDGVLVKELQAVVRRLDVLEQSTASEMEKHMMAIAQSITESVRAAMTEHAEAAAARTAESFIKEEKEDEADKPEAASAAISTLREELLTAIKAEMSKTHEVDLTPMFKYIDGLMSYIKEELEAQGGRMYGQFDVVVPKILDLVERQTSQNTLMESVRETIMQTSAAIGAEQHASAQAAATATETAMKALHEKIDRLSTSEEVHALMDKVMVVHSSAVRTAVPPDDDVATAEAAGIDATSSASASADQAKILEELQVMEEAASRRNGELLEAIHSLSDSHGPLHAKIETLQSHLVQAPSTGTTNIEMNGALEAILDTAKSQGKNFSHIQASLDAISAQLREQQEALSSLSVEVDEEDGSEGAPAESSTPQPTASSSATISSTTPNSNVVIASHVKTAHQTITSLQQSRQVKMAEVQKLVRKLDSGRERNVGPLLSQLNAQLAEMEQLEMEQAKTLSSVQQEVAEASAAASATATVTLATDTEGGHSSSTKNEEVLSVDAHASARRDHDATVMAVAAAAATAVTDATERVDALLSTRLEAVVEAQSAGRQEILAALASLSASTTSTEVRAALEAHSQEIKRLTQSTTEARASAESANTATISALTATEELMRKQSAELRAVVEEASAKAVAASAASVQSAQSALASAMEGVQQSVRTATAVAPQVSHQQVTSVKAKVPAWWLVLNPLLVVLAIFLCAYLLFACFLIAFVPTPVDPAAVSEATSVVVSPAQSDGAGADSISSAPSVASGIRPARKGLLVDGLL